MATVTRAEMANMALERLNVKSPSQAASAEDAALAKRAFDQVYAQLRKRGLAPFATATIPEWAQSGLEKMLAAQMAVTFGVTGQRLVEVKLEKKEGEMELARQVAGFRHPVPIKFRTY